MREEVNLKGVVLLTQPVGEYDKRMVILTRERGKITAFAHGVRRPKNPLIACANPFVFAEFRLYEGRDAYTLAGADVIDYFDRLAKEMPGVFYGYYFLELASYFGREGIEAGTTVDLIYVALRAVLKGQMSLPMIRAVYELRTLVENGEYAVPEEAGELDETSIYALKFIAGCELPKLFAFRLKEESEEMIIREARAAVQRTVDRPLKSLAVIEEMK